jgi:rod shape-determining protein MreC
VYDKTVRRRRAVLATLVVSSLILLTAYFGESAGGGLHAIQRGVMEVVSPIQEGASRALKPFRDLFGWVGDTFDAKDDLEDVRKERDEWKDRATRSEAAIRENRQLRELVGLGKALGLEEYGPETARVIGQSPTLWYATISIDKGTSAGIEKNMPVIASDGRDSGTGLIGKVTFAASNSAKVTLITDQSVAVPARNVTGTASGVVQTKVGDPRDLVMQFVQRDDPIEVRDTIVTSGTTSDADRLEGLYPPNIPIGRVTAIDEPETDAQEVHVKPFVDLRRIEFVQVLTRKVDGNRP